MACLLVFLLAGCGGSTGLTPSKQDEEQTVLNEVSQLYQLYTLERKKPPSNLNDFASYRAALTQGYDAVKSGQVVVLYGATMTDLAEGPPKGESDEVLAYEKQVPDSGGQVLMLNRAVKKMTADEFKAAKKAGKG